MSNPHSSHSPHPDCLNPDLFNPARFSPEALLSASGGIALTLARMNADADHVTIKPAAWQLSTDTRTIGPGTFFVPLSGARFNGHDFLAQAFQQGAEGAFVARSEWEKRQAEWQALPNLIGVDDPLQAYMVMAQYHRRRSHPNLKVVALTGSSGKTTTKEMLYAAFSSSRRTQKTEKNFNNEIGVSQTLLSLKPETELLIVEMGMRGMHQIDILSLCAEPDIAVITNVGPAHIEMLGSLEATAQAKLEIVQGIPKDRGILITNGDDPLLEKRTPEFWQPPHAHQWQKFSLQEASEIQTVTRADTSGTQFMYRGHSVYLPLPGQHNIANALAALKAGEALGIPLADMVQGLAHVATEDGRWNQSPLSGYQNAWVINDAYNANPDSCKAGLQAFLGMPFPGLKRVVVLGGMKELGPFSDDYHQALGCWLVEISQQKQAGADTIFPPDYLLTIGPEARVLAETVEKAQVFPVAHLETIEALVAHIRDHLPIDGCLFFLKGSRAYHLEQVSAQLSPAVIKNTTAENAAAQA